MARNHYVSQLIIRRFTDGENSINVFDVKKQSLIENRKSNRIFFKNDIYSEEIEKKFNKNLENPFSKLLDNKILGKDKIILTRNELKLVKKFLLLESIRTLTAEGYDKIFRGFSLQSIKYISKMQEEYSLILKAIPTMKELNEPIDEAFERALRVYLESKDINDIVMHKDVTKEIFVWAKVFNDSYIGFWDSNENQEFILTDNGLTTEYEPSHQLYGGLDLSKFSYLLHMLKKSNKKEKLIYYTLLDRIKIMYENFSIFNVSSSRSIVIINPFFKLYSNKGFSFNFNSPIRVEKPDIWPSYMIDNQVFKIPETRYKIKGKYLDEDEFIYIPQKLSLNDNIYVNFLFLSQSNNFLGFRRFTKIKDSLYAFQIINFLNKEKNHDNESGNIDEMIDYILNNEYNHIWQYYKDKEDIRPIVEPIELANRLSSMTVKDTRKNIYVLKYLLDGEERVRKMKNFSFMGTPDQRINLIKFDIKELENKHSITNSDLKTK